MKNIIANIPTTKLALGASAVALVIAGGVYFANSSADATSSDNVKIKTELSDAGEAWLQIRNSTNTGELNDFISQYPNSDYTGFARTRLNELERETIEVAETSPALQSANILGDKDRLITLQKALDRVGCKPGRTDGSWGYSSKNALRDFNKYASTNFDVDNPDQATLDKVDGTTYRVCPQYNATTTSEPTTETEEVVEKVESKVTTTAADTNPVPAEELETTPAPSPEANAAAAAAAKKAAARKAAKLRAAKAKKKRAALLKKKRLAAARKKKLRQRQLYRRSLIRRKRGGC